MPFIPMVRSGLRRCSLVRLQIDSRADLSDLARTAGEYIKLTQLEERDLELRTERSSVTGKLLHDRYSVGVQIQISVRSEQDCSLDHSCEVVVVEFVGSLILGNEGGGLVCTRLDKKFCEIGIHVGVHRWT